MAISEFDLIARFFTRATPRREDVLLGIGDDAAVLKVPPDRNLVVAVDTLVAGRHFPPYTAASDIGYKSLAVNLSDLAAMGASPAWATLSLTVPEVDETWLEGFAAGFFELADRYGVALVGGDTTRGPLSVTVQVHGLVQPGRALRRDAARPGQRIFVSGTLGDAAYALRQLDADQPVAMELLQRLNRPEPRLELGQALGSIGVAAIDISDGLLADLGHLLAASGCGAQLWVDRVPAAEALSGCSADQLRSCQLAGGDDYELCFTVDPEQVPRIGEASRMLGVRLTEIGAIQAAPGLSCLFDDGSEFHPQSLGYDHFA